MKKLVIGIVIGLLVASIGYAAKEVIINRGVCDKAKTRCILITQNREANTMRADAYWVLLDQNKRVIDDSQVTSFTTNYTGSDKKGWNDTFDQMQGFLKEGRINFSADDN